MAVKPVPDNHHTVTAHLVVRGAKAALAFYEMAFGAEVLNVSSTPDGSMVMNALFRIGDSTVMLADEMPMMEYWVSPQKLNGTTMGLHLFVEDVDTWFEQAKAAGLGTVMMEPQDTFWGDRYCQFLDPFGHAWSIATHKEDLTNDEVAQRAAEWFSKMGA